MKCVDRCCCVVTSVELFVCFGLTQNRLNQAGYNAGGGLAGRWKHHATHANDGDGLLALKHVSMSDSFILWFLTVIGLS